MSAFCSPGYPRHRARCRQPVSFDAAFASQAVLWPLRPEPEESAVAYTRTQAKTLLNASELALFDAGRTQAVRAHSPAQLRSKLQRSRRLRDKYRDLFRRQRLDTRQRTGSKDGRSGQANARSQEKAVLFDELMGRFQDRLDRVEAAADRKAMTKKVVAKKVAAKKATTKKVAARKAPARKVAAKKAAARKATMKVAATKAADGNAAATKVTARKAATRKAAPGKAATKTAAAKKVAARKGTIKKAATKKTAVTKAAVGKTAAKKVMARKAAAGKSAGRAEPDATTRAARLPAGKALDGRRGTPAEVAATPAQGVPPGLPDALAANASPDHGGFIDERARQVAQERHFATSGVKTIHAHISSRDRRKQGRRDDPEQ